MTLDKARELLRNQAQVADGLHKKWRQTYIGRGAKRAWAKVCGSTHSRTRFRNHFRF